MSNKILVYSVQPEVDGPIFARAIDPTDIAALQSLAHGHLEQIVKDLLMAGATGAQVAGFGAHTTGTLHVSVAHGTAVDASGLSYDSPDEPTVVELAAAHATLPRIDLIYATLEADAETDSALVSTRRLRTLEELEAVPPVTYPEVEIDLPTRLLTRATIGVHTGTPNASPTAPAAGADEVPLWRAHVAATQTVLVDGDLTSVRVLLKSLYSVIQDVLALQGQMAVLPETVQDIVGAFLAAGDGSLTFVYNDGANTFTLVLAAAYKALLDGATAANTASTLVKRDVSGNFYAGPLRLSPVGPPIGGYSQPGVGAVGNVASGVEVGVWSLAVAPGTVAAKITVETNAAQNSPIVRFYNARGGNPGSDRLRFLNDEFGRSFLFGQVQILVDSDGLGGSLNVAGVLSAGSKSFEIDHPVDPLNKDLRFATTESPNHGIECWGEAVLVAGSAVVNLDTAMGCSAGTFAALFDSPCCFPVNQTSYAAVKCTLSGSTLTITCENGSSTDTVNWQVKGRRKDELVKALPNSDEDGYLIVEFAKLAGDASRLNPTTRTGRADEAAPDVVVEEVVPELVGTIGYPRHASLAPALGPVPTREVTIETTDMDGAAYEP